MTLIPAAAAARSFERTASIRCPKLDRRTLATSRQSSTRHASVKKPKTGLGSLSSSPRNDESKPKLKPKTCGEGTGEAAEPPPQVELTKPNCSIATAAASVTTARLTPRTRKAETPMTSPSKVAAATPSKGPSGNPMPWSTAMCETVKPATPASASWTTEIWPTKPVITTSDRQIKAPSSETTSACRKSHGSTTSATAHAAVPIAAVRASRSGRGTAGRRFSISSPRPGRLAPRQNIAITMTTNTNNC